jgi:glycine cleavage system H lipoate-binding protein
LQQKSREGDMNGTNKHTTFNQATNIDSIHCLWMQAGVVDYKLCDRQYDCEHCPFDKAIHCPPDTQISGVEIRRQSTPSVSVQGCELENGLFYHPGHIWARVEEVGVVRAGLDDFGQTVLGPTYSINLPSPDTTVKSGEECWRFTHQSGAAALVSPVSGKVKEINRNLLSRPSLINRDPYGEGWAVLIEPGDLRSSLKPLLYGERARKWVEEEIGKLRLIISRLLDGRQSPIQTLNTTMTDGGLLNREFMRELSVAQMRQVIGSFFPSRSSEGTEFNNAISA